MREKDIGAPIMSSVPPKECDTADGTNRGFLPRDWVREKLVVCDNMAKILHGLMCQWVLAVPRTENSDDIPKGFPGGENY